MLTNLKVSNFALIEDLDINFKEGLTVLTGETGTGKSIILEALHLIFAKRSDYEMIRHGAEKAIVSASFTLNDEKQKLLELPNKINVERQIDINGRHKITLNNKSITLTYLNDLTNKIGLIHSQEDTLIMLDTNEYINFIDLMDFNQTNKYLNDYLIKRSEYNDSLNHLNKLKRKKDEDIEQEDFLSYQLNEIKSLNLVLNEIEDITDKLDKLKNFDTISSSLKESHYNLNNLINVDMIYDTNVLIEKIKDFDETYLDVSKRLADSYYELLDLRNIITDKLSELDFDEHLFDSLQERLYEIKKLEDKYKKSANELIKHESVLEEKLALINNYDEYIKKLEDKVLKLFNETYEKGLILSNYRKKLAKSFEKEMILELKDLDLLNTEFKVSFNTLKKEENKFYETGIDELDFLISLNEGEPIRPLNKVASGGERARFIFAIRSIYAKLNNLDVLVLDEIDIGISGKTAYKVANKMEELSDEMQVIVISHLPQVAARANNHYGINKELVNNRMVTNIKLLDYSNRVKMIALMLSGESLSEFAIEQAKTLLEK